MAQFESTIGIMESNNSSKTYVVGDGSSEDKFVSERTELTPEQFNALRESINKSKQETNKLSDATKSRIEMLANIGRRFRSFKLDDIVFELRSLKDVDLSEISLELSKLPNYTKLDTRRYMLAKSLYKIDGKPIDHIASPNDFDNDFESRMFVMRALQDVVVDRMFEEYNEMEAERNKAYRIQTKEEVKEVSEAIKK